jgi:hypothetical protein
VFHSSPLPLSDLDHQAFAQCRCIHHDHCQSSNRSDISHADGHVHHRPRVPCTTTQKTCNTSQHCPKNRITPVANVPDHFILPGKVPGCPSLYLISNLTFISGHERCHMVIYSSNELHSCASPRGDDGGSKSQSGESWRGLENHPPFSSLDVSCLFRARETVFMVDWIHLAFFGNFGVNFSRHGINLNYFACGQIIFTLSIPISDLLCIYLKTLLKFKDVWRVTLPNVRKNKT